jgi:hypothetical protein
VDQTVGWHDFLQAHRGIAMGADGRWEIVQFANAVQVSTRHPMPAPLAGAAPLMITSVRRIPESQGRTAIVTPDVVEVLDALP